ncbi:MAG TPA: hypothetical protein PKD55_10980, partial [Bellilinea sp.]|nr:hypothetical protein [Bellilinea sp.]
SVPRIWGLTVLQDQALAAEIMWIPTNMMYILAALLVLAQALQDEARRSLPQSDGETSYSAPAESTVSSPSN